MIARRALAVVAILVVMAPPAMAARPEGSVVEVSAPEGSYLEMDGRRYRGPLRITAESDGAAVVEVTSLDAYLEGIREVPFSWHEDALAAQVVAARTYLAWTLQGGRTETGSRIGYDICATAACQVYAGVDAVLGEDGDRWRQAVRRTSGEILVYQGEPARAFYSSTTGLRTRNIEDIWPGSEPAPYLVGVPSPGEDSPFVNWSWELPGYQMEQLLREADVADGDVRSITTRTTEDGQGPWMIDIVSDSGTVSMDTWALRSRINEAAAILPGLLPAKRPDGVDYPNTILSPEYSIRREVRVSRSVAMPWPSPFPITSSRGRAGGTSSGCPNTAPRRWPRPVRRIPTSWPTITEGSHRSPVTSSSPSNLQLGSPWASRSVRISSDLPLQVTVDGDGPCPGPCRRPGPSCGSTAAIQVIPPVRIAPWGGPDEF